MIYGKNNLNYTKTIICMDFVVLFYFFKDTNYLLLPMLTISNYAIYNYYM